MPCSRCSSARGKSPSQLEGVAENTADDWIKHGFYNYGTQYYIAARLAARARLNPVHGNQFHHAVELYLKAALLGTLSLAQMANKPYGHDLPALWEEFKKKEGDPKPLARFDSTLLTRTRRLLAGCEGVLSRHP